MNRPTQHAALWRRVLSAAVAAVLVAVGLVGSATTANAAAGEISGRVYLGSTAQIAGAGEVEVSLLQYVGATKSPYTYAGGTVTTDASGDYLFTGLPSSRFDVVFTYVGTGDFLPTWAPYTSFFANTVYNTTVPAAYTIAGHVDIDSVTNASTTGQVRVSLRTSAGGNEYASALTDASGDFVLPAVQVRGYVVQFTVPGDSSYPTWYYVAGDSIGSRDYTKATLFTPSADVTGVNVVVGNGPVISGVVRNSAGDPIVGMPVQALGLLPNPGEGVNPFGPSFTVVTASDGSYVFRALPQIYQYLITADSGGYATSRPSGNAYTPWTFFDITSGDSFTDADLVMYLKSALSGSISGPGVALMGPDAGWSVLLSYYDPVTQIWSEPSTFGGVDAALNFSWDHLVPGDYRFSLMLHAPCILLPDYSCTTSGPYEIVARTGIVTVTEDVDIVVNFDNITLGSLAVGRLVKSNAAGSTQVYLVNGRKSLVRVNQIAIAVDAGIAPTVTLVAPSSLAPYVVESAPLSNVVRCSGRTYVASLGWLWAVEPEVVAGVPTTDLDVLACEPQVIWEYTATSALFVQSPTGLIYVIDDGKKRLLSNRVGVHSYGSYYGFVLPVSNSFLNSLPTGSPIEPLLAPQLPPAFAPFVDEAVSALSPVAAAIKDGRAGCYTAYLDSVGISLYAPTAAGSDAAAALSACLAG